MSMQIFCKVTAIMSFLSFEQVCPHFSGKNSKKNVYLRTTAKKYLVLFFVLYTFVTELSTGD